MRYNTDMDKQKHILIKNEKAFTLVEMIVAIVVLGILVGIAIPVFSTFIASKSLDAAIRQVASDIREAQARAMAEDIYYYGVYFDELDDRYFVHRDTTTPTLFNETNRLSWGAHGETTITLPNEIIFNSSVKPDPITFNNSYGEDKLVIGPNGYTGTPGSVYLQNEKGKERSLSVVTTGKVNIK